MLNDIAYITTHRVAKSHTYRYVVQLHFPEGHHLAVQDYVQEVIEEVTYVRENICNTCVM